jgi:ribosomal protein L16 Arg81 hydroxylase
MMLATSLGAAFPEIAQLAKQIRLELDMPSYALVRDIVYCSPRCEGTSLHFDQNMNFVIQLSGEKTWFLAPNTHVENPTMRYSFHMGSVPRLLSEYTDALPHDAAEIEKNATKVKLVPGDVLFVPRGWWHATACPEEGLQLNFTSNCPTWAEIFAAALRRNLQRQPVWRGLASGLRSDNPQRRSAAKDHVRRLIGEATAIMSAMDVDRLFDDAEWWTTLSVVQDALLRRTPGASLELVGSTLTIQGATGDGVTMDLDSEYIDLVRHICTTTRPITEAELIAEYAAIDPPNLRRFLLTLQRYGALEKT